MSANPFMFGVEIAWFLAQSLAGVLVVVAVVFIPVWAIYNFPFERKRGRKK